MTNLKQLLYNSPYNMVFTSSWLEKQGISRKSVYTYKKNGWITPLGHGAFIKKGTMPMLDSAIVALQTQLLLPIHLGGKSALSERYNVAHFLKFKKEKSDLFAPNGTRVPAWFRSAFANEYNLILSDFLPQGTGIINMEISDSKITVSSPERAFLEMLYSVPQKTSVKEAYQILEMLFDLRPKLLNELLLQCKSVKVKRLFLYLASEAKHDWFEQLDIKHINLGSGVRSIDKLGKYSRKYKLVIDSVGDI